MNADFLAAIGGHPLVAEILWQRGYTTLAAAAAFLNPDSYTPTAHTELPDMAVAVARLQQAIATQERIRIWGDFDVDGQTSTSLLLLGLRDLGALVDYTIPNRATQNHGLNADGLRQAAAERVRILLTCDCGVTDFDEVALARELGLDVIISDHHDLAHDANGDLRLPVANAILNPKRLPATHPFASLPGVGVAYKLIEGLQGAMGEVATLQSFLDLVALGIICDVAEQRGDTRYLLQRGLQQLRNNPRLGVRQLLQATGFAAEQLDAENIGYQLGPRLNSAGRLDTASLSVDLLTTDDAATAKTLALRIETLNQERKILQRKVDDDALALLAQQPSLRNEAVIVLSAVAWPPSVLGVVASSVSQRLQKPTILISAPLSAPSSAPADDGADDEVARGSARSFGDVDIHAAIAAQADLIISSGGHPMAAGFSIRPEHINAFKKRISQFVAQSQLAQATSTDSADSPANRRQSAVYDIAWKDVSLALCNDLERLAPFGAGNPRPSLRSERVIIARVDPIGSEGRHQALWLKDSSGHTARALWWGSTGQALPSGDIECDAVFTLHRNWYRGKVSLSITLHQLQPRAETSPPTTSAATEPPTPSQISGRFRILDHRNTPDLATAWQRLSFDYGEANIARFGDMGVIIGKFGLVDVLEPRPVLAIGIAPPGPDTLRALLAQVNPQVVALFGRPAAYALDQWDGLLTAILGMLKVAAKRGDNLASDAVIERMASRVKHRPATVRTIIDDINRDAKPSPTLDFLLAETRAYRHYFCTAASEAVLAVGQASG